MPLAFESKFEKYYKNIYNIYNIFLSIICIRRVDVCLSSYSKRSLRSNKDY